MNRFVSEIKCFSNDLACLKDFFFRVDFDTRVKFLLHFQYSFTFIADSVYYARMQGRREV